MPLLKFVSAVLWAPISLVLLPYFFCSGAWKAGRGDLHSVYRVVCYAYGHLLFMFTMAPQIAPNVFFRWRNKAGSKPNDLPVVKSVDYETPFAGITGGSVKPNRCRAATDPMSLDVYPMPAGSQAPVIVYLYGGAFSSGEKVFYYRLAKRLREHCNAVVVVPDYPTYPRGTIQEMSESVARCLMWTGENAEKYGGSRDHIWVVGHSAGAFLASYTLLRSMMAKASNSNTLPDDLCAQGVAGPPVSLVSSHGSLWEGSSAASTSNAHAAMPHPSRPATDYLRVPPIQGCILLSGLYDVAGHIDFERSIYVDLISSIRSSTGGYFDSLDLPKLCQSLRVNGADRLRQDMGPRKGFYLLHGEADAAVDVKQTKDFHSALRELSQASFGDHRLCPAHVTDTSATHVGSIWGIITLPDHELPADPSMKLLLSLINGGKE